MDVGHRQVAVNTQTKANVFGYKCICGLLSTGGAIYH